MSRAQGDVDVGRAWIRRKAKSQAGQERKLNAGCQLTNDEM